MSSWTFAVMLPDSADELDAVAGLRVLSEMSVDEEAFVVRIDSEGLIRHGSSVDLPAPPLGSACEQLETGAQLQLTCRDENVYFTFMVADVSDFQTVVLGWSRRAMAEAQSLRPSYFGLLEAVAIQARAAVVLFVDGPPDGWLGQIMRVNGQYLVSPVMPSGLGIDYRYAWVRAPSELPEGLQFRPVGEQLQGFTRFDVVSDA